MDGAKVSTSTPSVASRTPPKEAEPRSSETASTNNNTAKGAFWSTQYAQAAKPDEPVSRQEKSSNNKASLPVKNTSPPVNNRYLNNSPPKNGSSPPGKSNVVGTARQNQGVSQTPKNREHSDYEDEPRQSTGWQNEDEPGRSSSTSRQKHAVPEPAMPTNDSSFAAFEAEYSQSVLQSRSLDQLKDEVHRLNEALRQAQSEKVAITLKFEKLTTICRSQRQEIQELKSQINLGTERNSNSIQQQQQNSALRARASQSFEQASNC